MKNSLDNEHTVRITQQREIILEELRSVTTHPTADELYDRIRKRLPRISLATVYRNLEWLSDKNLAQKLEIGGRQKRYDANTSSHYHIRCVRCDRVDDIDGEPLSYLEKKLNGTNGYEILGHRLEFQGLCPHCQKNSR